MAKEYLVRILKWEKYQSRKVKERTAWFRLQNDFIESPNFSDFNSDERMVWLYAMCCASKLNRASIHVPAQCSPRVLDRCSAIDENTFHQTFQKLKKLQIVELRTSRGSYADDTFTNAEVTLRDETRRDEYVKKTKRRSSNDYTIAFEEIYDLYPEKLGKKKAFAEYQKTVLSPEDRDLLITTIKGYVADCKAKDRFLKHFDTFMNNWRDIGQALTAQKPAPQKLKGMADLLAEQEAAKGGVDVAG